MPLRGALLFIGVLMAACIVPAQASPVANPKDINARAAEALDLGVGITLGDKSLIAEQAVDDALTRLRALHLPAVDSILANLITPASALLNPAAIPTLPTPSILPILSGTANAGIPLEATQPRFPNATLPKREADPLTLKIPTIPTPALPNLSTLQSLGMTGTAGSGCPATTNNQSNQCSSGVPYCCSPDGDGGNVCANGTVSCQQTVICCNNFNGMQFCMGDIDFNMPITINLNLGRKRK